MMTRESMMVLKEKLVEMERGMEFLSLKGQDYEELQLLAEEELMILDSAAQFCHNWRRVHGRRVGVSLCSRMHCYYC